MTGPAGGADDLPEEGAAPFLLPIEEAIDLHTFAPKDIPDVVTDYLEECARRGFREVRLIHGRGTGTQRAIVQALLTGHPLVEDFADAPPDRGGWGATVVRLRDAHPAG
ncbi:MAG TPA: Smr/MutS family protein [Candidatus Methylomirabilis sp.]|nr:Smr/MutS family protein [Candidatus Methylomirabilis sp.]